MSIAHFATALKNSCLAPIQVAIDAGAGPGTLKIYTGTLPALPSDAVTTQTLLGTLTFLDPCGTTSAGALTMTNPITQDSSADATGTATWARIADSTGATVMDIDVSNTGGSGTMWLNTTNIVAGGPILCTSFVISVS